MQKKYIYIALFVLVSFSFVNYYPITAYELTGIRRLAHLEDVKNGVIKGKTLPEGALLNIEDIKLNLIDRDIELTEGVPEIDLDLQKKIKKLFRGLNRNYSITVLDMSDNKPIRFAKHRETAGYQPGSVGKLVVLSAFFTAIKDLYPDDFEDRRALLKAKQVTAGKWVVSDHHTVPFYDPDTQKYFRRGVRSTDVFSMYEWLDHMVSVSNNGAASVVWRETILMNVFQDRYPTLTYEEGQEYFKNTPKRELAEQAICIVNQPLRELGISNDEWRLGSFFTGGAKSFVPKMGGSIGSSLGLMKFVIALESGKVVDKESSLEMKRLLYMTGRRIRYAASNKLKKAAVYFKSGSLYKCDREKDSLCRAYAGNVYNYMNSVAIIEHPEGQKYAVCLMSNVLHKNSASDHYALASRIDKLITEEEEEN